MFKSIDFSPIINQPREEKRPITRDIFWYAKKVARLQRDPVVEFKPGINILLGPNGSGKSTIARALGKHMAAVQGGVSTVTHSWVHNTMTSLDYSTRSWLEPYPHRDLLLVKVEHDGQAVAFADSREAVGLYKGVAFDDDFFGAALPAMRNNEQSHGQVSAGRLDATVERMKAGFSKEVVWGKTAHREWLERDGYMKLINARFGASTTLGQQSVIMDEPELNLSWWLQGQLWQFLAEQAKHYQIIIATHSPFCLSVPEANIIEMVPGYHEDMVESFRDLARALKVVQ